MTRNEFIRDIEDFYDLCRFAYENDVECMSYVKDWDAYKDWINDNINYWDNGPFELGEWLYSLPDCGGWFDVEYEVTCIDGDFEDYKERVLEEMDRYGQWDEEDEEEEAPAAAPAQPADLWRTGRFECPPPPDPEPENEGFLMLLRG